MIRLVLENRSNENAHMVLWGNDVALPKGAEYKRKLCGIDLAYSTTTDDKSEKKEYDRINKTPQDVLDWMRKNITISELALFRVMVSRRNKANNEFSLPGSFFKNDKDKNSVSRSRIVIDGKERSLCKYFQCRQFQMSIIDIINDWNRYSIRSAKQISIIVAPVECIKIFLSVGTEMDKDVGTEKSPCMAMYMPEKKSRAYNRSNPSTNPSNP